MSNDLAPESSSPLSLNLAAFSSEASRGDVKDSAPVPAAPTAPVAAVPTATNGRTTAGQDKVADTPQPALITVPTLPTAVTAVDRTNRAATNKKALWGLAGALGIGALLMVAVPRALPTYTGTVLASDAGSVGGTTNTAADTTPPTTIPTVASATDQAEDYFADYGTYTGLTTRVTNTDCGSQPCMAGAGRQAVVTAPTDGQCLVIELLDGRVVQSRAGSLAHCNGEAIGELQAYFDGQAGIPSQTEQNAAADLVYGAAAELQQIARRFVVDGSPSFANVPADVLNSVEHVAVLDMLPGGNAVIVDVTVGKSCQRVVIPATASATPLDSGTCPVN